MPGVTVSQAFANERNNALALRLLTQGFTARSVLQQLMANDPYAEYRQIGVIDRSGMAVAHTGPHTRGWSGHVVGENYVAFGNGLVGPEVADAIAKGFLAEPDADLEHRLLMGIEAGRDAGGQGTRERHKAERSAALRVYSTRRLCRHRPARRSACDGGRGAAARLDRVQAVRSLLSRPRAQPDAAR